MVRDKKKPIDIFTGPDIDLETEVILDSDGRRIDQAYVDEVVEAFHETADRRAGRPSLSGKSEHSPLVSFRIPAELKSRAEDAAIARGITLSKLAREALEKYLAS